MQRNTQPRGEWLLIAFFYFFGMPLLRGGVCYSVLVVKLCKERIVLGKETAYVWSLGRETQGCWGAKIFLRNLMVCGKGKNIVNVVLLCSFRFL